jgi:hypothetical protein
MTGNNCEKCRYWSKFKDDPDVSRIGHCRRHAPRATSEVKADMIKDDDIRMLAENGTDSGSFALGAWPIWPLTFNHHWCGEWALRIPSAEGA